VVAALGGRQADPANLSGWTSGGLTGSTQAATLLFFAFAGYARIATLDEEVRDPARTGGRVPKAVPSLVPFAPSKTAPDDRLAAYGLLDCYSVCVFVCLLNVLLMDM
jgi:amino acid transporter